MFTNNRDKLLTPIEYLKGVGPGKGAILRKELVQGYDEALWPAPGRLYRHYVPRRFQEAPQWRAAFLLSRSQSLACP